MNERIGFVWLGGVKMLVRVRKGKTCRWVSARLENQEGPHLATVERALKKVRHAKVSLAEQKVVAI